MANKANYKLAYYHKNNNSWSKSAINIGTKNGHTTILAVSNNGKKVVYQYSTASKLPAFYVSDLSKNKFLNEKEVVKLNKRLSKKSITKSEVFV